MFPESKPSLGAQIECVEREIRMRRHVYPRRVADGKMSTQTADREIALMVAVAETLQLCRKLEKT